MVLMVGHLLRQSRRPVSVTSPVPADAREAAGQDDGGVPGRREELGDRAAVQVRIVHRRIWARKPGSSGPGGSACLVWSLLSMDILIDDRRWGFAAGCGEVGRGLYVSGGAGRVGLVGVLLAQSP
jgi:hypothetical protein